MCKITQQRSIFSTPINKINPFTPKVKSTLSQSFSEKWYNNDLSIWVSYEKPSSSYCVMQYYWWGYSRNLNLITLETKRHCTRISTPVCSPLYIFYRGPILFYAVLRCCQFILLRYSFSFTRFFRIFQPYLAPCSRPIHSGNRWWGSTMVCSSNHRCNCYMSFFPWSWRETRSRRRRPLSQRRPGISCLEVEEPLWVDCTKSLSFLFVIERPEQARCTAARETGEERGRRPRGEWGR